MRLYAEYFVITALLAALVCGVRQVGHCDEPRNVLPLEIDVLTQRELAYQRHTQRWLPVFQRIQRRVTFRGPRPGDRIGLQNIDRNGRMSVKVTGLMNRDGTIVFPDHAAKRQTFSLTEPDALSLWLEKVEEFGAMGPPRDNPTWGLTTEQFKTVLKLLSEPVSQPISMKSSVEAIDSLDLPSVFRVTYTDEARKRAFAPAGSQQSYERLNGYSKGSALAVTLAQFGLGFRPLPESDAGFVLQVDAGDETDNMFPVGWNSTTSVLKLVPKLSVSVQQQKLNEVDLDGLIQLLADTIELPHFYSSFSLSVAGVEPEEIKFSRDADRISPYNLMRTIGLSHNMGFDVRSDEAGKVFLWVTTRDEYLHFRQRFSRNPPAR